MSKTDKLFNKLKDYRRSITYLEVETLLKSLGYVERKKGKTAGSKVTFIHESRGPIGLHKPHTQKELKKYQRDQILEVLI